MLGWKWSVQRAGCEFTAGATSDEAKPFASPAACSAFCLTPWSRPRMTAHLRLGWRAWPLTLTLTPWKAQWPCVLGSRARRFQDGAHPNFLGSSVGCCLSEVTALISKPPIMCWRWWPMGRPLRWLVAGWKGTGKPPFPTVSGKLENVRSSNRSALTPCWLVWPSTWQQGRLNVDRWWTR